MLRCFCDVALGTTSKCPPFFRLLAAGFVPLGASTSESGALMSCICSLLVQRTPLKLKSYCKRVQADAIALARGMLYNLRWPWHAAAELGT